MSIWTVLIIAATGFCLLIGVEIWQAVEIDTLKERVKEAEAKLNCMRSAVDEMEEAQEDMAKDIVHQGTRITANYASHEREIVLNANRITKIEKTIPVLRWKRFQKMLGKAKEEYGREEIILPF